MAIAAFMGYDYYKNKDGPATCINYRFWAKKDVPEVVAPVVPVAAPATGSAKTAGKIGISTYVKYQYRPDKKAANKQRS